MKSLITAGLAVIAIGFCASLNAPALLADQFTTLTIVGQNAEKGSFNPQLQADRIFVDAERVIELDLHFDGRPIREIEVEALTGLYQYFNCNKNGLLENEETFHFPNLGQLRQQLWNPFGVSRGGWGASDGAATFDKPQELVDRFRHQRLSFVHVGYGKDEASSILSERLRELVSAFLKGRTSQDINLLLHQQFESLDTNRDGQLSAGEIVRDLAYPSCSTSIRKFNGASADSIQRFKIALGQTEGAEFQMQSTAFQPLQPQVLEPATFVRYDSGKGLEMVKSAKEHLEQLFQELDKDHDRTLAADELDVKAARLMREMLTVADVNRDKNLTEQELANWLKVWGEVVRAQIQISVLEQSVGLWEKVDANMDGRLSLAEWLGFDWLGFDDEDVASEHRRICITISHGQPLSVLNEPSALAGRSPGALPVAPQWFQAADSNGDQHLQKEEFVGPITLFSRWDRNGDGLVSLAEIE